MARRAVRRRLQLSLLLLVVATATAAAVPFLARRPVDEASSSAARAEAGIEAVLRLSTAVRDAYAHQAHVFILNDATHVEHYRDTARGMLRALAAAHQAVAGSRAAPLLVGLETEARALDDRFRGDIVPKIGGDRAALIAPAEQAIVRVERMQIGIDQAAELLAADRDAARAALAQAMTRSRVTSGIVLCLAVLVALGAALLLDRSLSRPLGRLEAATDALATGDLHARVGQEIAGRDDELGSLAVRFNLMAERLEEREARLMNAERLAAVGRLAAGVAHEINNPLGVILGHARLLEKRVDEEGRRDVVSIVNEVERCKEIVGGLLDLSRPPRLRVGPVDLEELCREMLDRSRPAEADTKVDVRGDVNVDADADKLLQVLANLLMNAEQAGARRIEVAIDGTDARWVRISVTDDGAGLSAEAAAKLFTPFFTTKAEGTGLGLAVSRAIASAHGGELEHAPLAAGARFHLTIPRRAPQREGST